MSGGLKILLPFACCLILANIYYAQPILTDIAKSIGLDVAASGVIMTMLQIGYILGVLLLGPLGDVLENRRLIAFMVLGSAAALLAAAWSGSVGGFFVATLFIGFFSASTQIIVPFAAGLAADTERGKILGLIMAGIFIGIVLARPVSSLMTSAVGWRSVYLMAAALMLIMSVTLFRLLPRKAPSAQDISYTAMLSSMGRLLVTVPRLPLQMMLSAVVFMGITMFWTTAPVVLQKNLDFSHSQMALFTLAGLVTPPCAVIAGRLIDRGFGPILIFTGVIMTVFAYLLMACLEMYAATFVLAIFLLDPGANVTNLTVQQSILSSTPDARSRLNALCVACNFSGGAIGSALGPWIFSHFGWQAVSGTGAALMLIPFILNLVMHGAKVKALFRGDESGSKTVCESVA